MTKPAESTSVIISMPLRSAMERISACFSLSLNTRKPPVSITGVDIMPLRRILSYLPSTIIASRSAILSFIGAILRYESQLTYKALGLDPAVYSLGDKARLMLEQFVDTASE